MRCESCGFANPEGLKFCGQCAAPLKHRCLSCGFENPPGFKFCGACATPLTARQEGEKAKRGKGEEGLTSSVQRLASEGQERAPLLQTLDPRPRDSRLDVGERRQLTVMFIDLVGSTTLSQQLDPEDYHGRVVAYQTACHQVIARYEGHIAQYLGDGVLVYFGYPVAHEDDAVRAVRSGLEIVEALRHQVPSPVQGEEQGEVRLQVRIGIHTGLVVIGEIGSSEKREMLALGETPNLAARIQGQAHPSEVIISAATSRLVEGLFVCEERGQPELKGVAVPLTLYRVEKESEAQSRFQVVARQGLTPLVGREHEYGLLQDRWQRVQDGAGQIVLLSGEPGIGKSRLVEALKERVEHEGTRCLELRCSPYAQNSALQPVIEHLQRTLHFRPEDSAEEKLRKLENVFGRRGGFETRPYTVQTETLPLLAALLSLPHPDGYPTVALSPQKQKEKTYEVLVAWLCAEAKQQAAVYAWEDLHWADPSTLELLTLFLQQVPTTRLLTVLTFRPEFTPPWGAHSYLSQLSLSRLGRNHVETMVEKVTGGTVLPTGVVQQIVSKTDGVPLFVEELTKSVVESGGATGRLPLQSLDIPSTLQDSLMARLDRLGTAKEVAQLGATLGREFTYALLHAISPLHEDTLQQGLKQLVESELVYQSGLPPQARYLFKHALVQDTAYQSLLKSRRQQLHQQIANVLEKQLTEITETQPELLAHHYAEAGMIEQAIQYWQKAGERANRYSANVEAINHFTKGLELLTTLPDLPNRTEQELALQTAIGGLWMVTKDWAAPEVEHAYARARELCQQVGETPQLAPVLWGLTSFYGMKGDMQTTTELAEQLMHLAQGTQDPTALILAHRVYGVGSYWRGEFLSALDHFEQVLSFYDRQQPHAQAYLSVLDSATLCRGYLSGTLWCLGYPDQARKKIHEALTSAQEMSHPNSLTYAHGWATLVHHHRRDAQAVQEQARILIALCTERQFLFFLTRGRIFYAWARIEQGDGEEGLAQIRQELRAEGNIRTGLDRTYYLALAAEVCRRMGQIEEGLTLVTEALELVINSGRRAFEAELYRLKGELTLQSHGQRPESRVREAEEYFLKATEIARAQQAKSLELRAATSLARLWQQQSKRAEAHKLLSEIYNWFTEGFDTKDLQEAKGLLEELQR